MHILNIRRLLQYTPLFFLIFCGCEKYYISIKRDTIDQSKLASTFVESPDPRQKNPPKGEKLIIEWRLPSYVLHQYITLQLNIIYNNYSEQTLYYPVNQRKGIIIYSLLEDQYYKTGGFLTYVAKIKKSDGTVLKEWKQWLWVDRISLDDIDPHKKDEELLPTNQHTHMLD